MIRPSQAEPSDPLRSSLTSARFALSYRYVRFQPAVGRRFHPLHYAVISLHQLPALSYTLPARIMTLTSWFSPCHLLSIPLLTVRQHRFPTSHFYPRGAPK